MQAAFSLSLKVNNNSVWFLEASCLWIYNKYMYTNANEKGKNCKETE